MKMKTKKIISLFLCLALVLCPVLSEKRMMAKSKIYLNRKKVTVTVRKTVKLKIKGTKKKVTWKSLKRKIATVSQKGVVKGCHAGKTSITAKVAGKKFVCRVTVKPKKKKTGIEKPTSTPAETPIPTPIDTSKPEPVFSRSSGSYANEFDLELYAPEGSTIYYTTDGSIPLYENDDTATDKSSRFPEKLPTKQYNGTIRVKNRDGKANRLCSKANIPCMYHPEEFFNGPFYPKVSGVPKATIIRALAVDAEGNKSKVVTKVYFVDKNLQSVYKNASVISIVTDPDNLLSKSTGIYRYGNWENSGAEWERPADVTYFDEDGKIPFETTMGLRIHGNYTRRWGQKSLRLYFREELGMKNLKDYQLIPGAVNADGTPTTKYKNFILRNGGNEYAYSKMQDVFIQRMVSNRAFSTQSARPCVAFLNGEYWGIYNLTERYSDNYLEKEYGVDKENVVVIKTNKEEEKLEEGLEEDFALYEELKSMEKLDMSQQSNYEKFKKMVDIRSCLDYYATEIYIGNNDWPGNNVQIWRTRTNDGTTYGDTKWRYMLYDTEFSMDLWGSDKGGTINRIDKAKTGDNLFNALCKNAEFRKNLADTLMDICHNNFNVNKATKKLNAMAKIYRPLIAQYKARFGNGDVDSRVTDMKSYIAGREKQLKNYIKSSLGITVK